MVANGGGMKRKGFNALHYLTAKQPKLRFDTAI